MIVCACVCVCVCVYVCVCACVCVDSLEMLTGYKFTTGQVSILCIYYKNVDKCTESLPWSSQT